MSDGLKHVLFAVLAQRSLSRDRVYLTAKHERIALNTAESIKKSAARIRAEFDVDVANPDTFEKGFPDEYFTALRKEAPIHFHTPEVDIKPFWVITKQDHIREISRNPADFSSQRGGSNIEDYEGDDLSAIQMMLINLDPPQHNKFRKLVASGFTPRLVRAMESKIRAEVNDILDEIQGQDSCEFVTAVAAELPLRVICELMGVPREERHLVFDWSNRLIGFDDPEFQTSLEDSRLAAMEVWQYASNLAETRKGEEGDDLVRVLMNAEVDGEKISEPEFTAFFLLLSVAGNETTRNAISHGIRALAANPDEWTRLQKDRSLLDTAVEETVRWATPVIYFRRTVTRDLDFHGHQFKENDKLAIYYSSGNRDEAVFDDPFRFDVGRNPNDHIAFGHGQHFCLGASLARLEIKVFYDELLKRVERLTPNGDLRFLRSNFINGIKEMPVGITWK
ncbi:MAG: cholest-4-en-3-one 26-monooxygenase [Bradymonadia bacterium]